MFAYRVDKQKYISSLLEGMPGEKSDFRWNTEGNAIIYASSSKSLALNEKTGNMSKPFFGLKPSYVMVKIELPDADYRMILPKNLPNGWDDIGAYHPTTQEIGDTFTASDELVLLVPSTIINGEFNVLINPNKVKDFDIQISTEEINERLQDLR